MNQHGSQVPQLLVSIRDTNELAAALDGGADWIDLKEPRDGPLAAVEQQVALAVAEALPSGQQLSAALGELRDWQNSAAQELLTVPGISVVKLGLAGCARMHDWQQHWCEIFQRAHACGKQLAGVAYADWERAFAPSPAEVVSLAGICGCRFLLIDTYEKQGRSTLDFLPENVLRTVLQDAKEMGMTTVLAGSLTLDTLEKIRALPVGVVAVRGAVCSGQRTGMVEAELVRDFRLALSTSHDQLTYAKVALQAE